MPTAAFDNRPTATYPGDATDSVGRVMGPRLDGRELLVVDEAVFDEAAGRTRVWFRYATRQDTGDIAADPALIAARVDLATPTFDLPAWLAGPAGYVTVTCDGCGATTREWGITDTSKAWALCPDCRAKPDAHARIDAKRRDNMRGRS